MNVLLKQIRIEHGFSQEELAKKMNVSRQSISRWENGRSTPDPQNLMQLCKIYNVSMNYFIESEIIEKESDLVEQPYIENKTSLTTIYLLIIVLIGMFIPVIGLLLLLYVFFQNKKEKKSSPLILFLILIATLININNSYVIINDLFINNGTPKVEKISIMALHLKNHF